MAFYTVNFKCSGEEYNATLNSSYPQENIENIDDIEDIEDVEDVENDENVEPDLLVLQENVEIAIIKKKEKLNLIGKDHFVLEASYTMDEIKWDADKEELWEVMERATWIPIDITDLNVRV